MTIKEKLQLVEDDAFTYIDEKLIGFAYDPKLKGYIATSMAMFSIEHDNSKDYILVQAHIEVKGSRSEILDRFKNGYFDIPFFDYVRDAEAFLSEQEASMHLDSFPRLVFEEELDKYYNTL